MYQIPNPQRLHDVEFSALPLVVLVLICQARTALNRFRRDSNRKLPPIYRGPAHPRAEYKERSKGKEASEQAVEYGFQDYFQTPTLSAIL